MLLNFLPRRDIMEIFFPNIGGKKIMSRSKKQKIKKAIIILVVIAITATLISLVCWGISRAVRGNNKNSEETATTQSEQLIPNESQQTPMDTQGNQAPTGEGFVIEDPGDNQQTPAQQPSGRNIIIVDTCLNGKDDGYTESILKSMQILKERGILNEESLVFYANGYDVVRANGIGRENFSGNNLGYLGVLDYIFRDESYKQSGITQMVILSNFDGFTGEVFTWDNFFQGTHVDFCYPEGDLGEGYKKILKNLNEPIAQGSDVYVNGSYTLVEVK